MSTTTETRWPAVSAPRTEYVNNAGNGWTQRKRKYGCKPNPKERLYRMYECGTEGREPMGYVLAEGVGQALLVRCAEFMGANRACYIEEDGRGYLWWPHETEERAREGWTEAELAEDCVPGFIVEGNFGSEMEPLVRKGHFPWRVELADIMGKDTLREERGTERAAILFALSRHVAHMRSQPGSFAPAIATILENVQVMKRENGLLEAVVWPLSGLKLTARVSAEYTPDLYGALAEVQR